jgi:hypothetical protein
MRASWRRQLFKFLDETAIAYCMHAFMSIPTNVHGRLGVWLVFLGRVFHRMVYKVLAAASTVHPKENAVGF